MLVCTLITVNVPFDLAPEQLQELTSQEVAQATLLQQHGKLQHLWRVAGRKANVSVWNVTDLDDFHQSINSLPMFRFFEVEVIPLAQHPTALTRD